ncbi:uncharacterized protein [Dendrobates tinctorius]|uniref:uncharacterized protein n=1 Tax=Dendrobates tinctorius TaxID=92724 RepID=UPI003CC9557E
MQRSLGLLWNLQSDTFTIQLSQEEKHFTHRGVLSTINSLYDPLGFAAPVTIQGKALLRNLTKKTSDWDAPLPPHKKSQWEVWKKSLAGLSNLNVPRPYTPVPSTEMQSQSLYVFADASVKAIAAVAYLKTVDSKCQSHIGFVMGKAKLPAQPEHTIPRLELCAAVLAVELAELIASEMDIDLTQAEFYSDSKLVLGCIHNETRRFYVYVNNRVLRIRRSVHPKQWQYIPTDQNPADHATRAVDASRLRSTTWLSGPKLLYTEERFPDTFELVRENSDAEIRPQVSTLHTMTPATLTLKTGLSSAPPGGFDAKDLYKCQWRQVQSFSNTFWDRWCKQYLSTLQPRTKWQSARPNLGTGDLVLVKDCQVHRNQWPLGLVTATFPSKDGNVRKVELRMAKGNELKTFSRLVTKLVLLFSSESKDSDIHRCQTGSVLSLTFNSLSLIVCLKIFTVIYWRIYRMFSFP